jgi:hypothetical protein
LVDIVTALAAGAVGLGLGGVVSYYVFNSRPKAEKVVVAAPGPDARAAVTTVSSAELERSKREMRTTMVERDLLSSALMRLYEAESEGRITREEREIISRRYSEQIKDLQSKLKGVELLVEVGELEGLRNELLALFQDKIQNIETRLDAAKQRLGPATPEPSKKEPAPKAEGPADLEKAVERRAKPEISSSERRVKEIRDEVMEALTRLEQIDIDKKQQEG